MNNIIIARSAGGATNTTLTEWSTNTQSLVKELSAAAIGDKDGSYFIRCTGTERNNTDTSDSAHVLILDGDSRINEDGEIMAGAPEPELVHQVLIGLDFSHLLYSSFSNDVDYHKYRIVIPCKYSPEQLPVLLNYLFNELHQAGVMLAPVPENRTWSQPWYFPRIPDEQRKALFKFYHHDGAALDAEAIHKDWLRQQTEPEPPQYKEYKPQPNENIKGWRNPIKEFNQTFSVHDVLIRNGYIKKGSKYLRPDSTSKIASVQLCDNCEDGAQRAFSHGGDVLNDGFAHDAFDCFRLLEHGGEW